MIASDSGPEACNPNAIYSPNNRLSICHALARCMRTSPAVSGRRGPRRAALFTFLAGVLSSMGKTASPSEAKTAIGSFMDIGDDVSGNFRFHEALFSVGSTHGMCSSRARRSIISFCLCRTRLEPIILLLIAPSRPQSPTAHARPYGSKRKASPDSEAHHPPADFV